MKPTGCTYKLYRLYSVSFIIIIIIIIYLRTQAGTSGTNKITHVKTIVQQDSKARWHCPLKTDKNTQVG